ncbi:hypothetical protein SAMN05660209_05015 [Geodermatophilus africanus]|uniref:Uncharacterized protein n=1 Tax=Geodermatophilus africanus TaxID=1137993 RepID=A0A1H3R483_9ACTN|nr:hypothetical protein [Geodermatophilus africanus]SDZ20313.1 hypothetical protein SAMN05660209_05015 [Geodermatophilus africanus]
MDSVIIYVHGDGNKPEEKVLKEQWDEALFGEGMGAASRMAYWRPLRHPTALADSDQDEDDVQPLPGVTESAVEAGPAAGVPPEVFISDTVARARKEAELLTGAEAVEVSGAAKRLEDWLRAMTYAADALTRGQIPNEAVTRPQEVLPLPRSLRVRAFRPLVRRTFLDVHAYFFGGYREPIRQVMRSALEDLDGPAVVVGHSLGSIIAYDVLAEASSARLQVPLFVTVGSPLGITEVQDLVEQPLRVPSAVKAWLNASDIRDLVALDHTIRPEYRPEDRCTDVIVTNNSGNHHGIQEYLRASQVQWAVRQVCQS